MIILKKVFSLKMRRSNVMASWRQQQVIIVSKAAHAHWSAEGSHFSTFHFSRDYTCIAEIHNFVKKKM